MRCHITPRNKWINIELQSSEGYPLYISMRVRKMRHMWQNINWVGAYLKVRHPGFEVTYIW